MTPKQAKDIGLVLLALAMLGLAAWRMLGSGSAPEYLAPAAYYLDLNTGTCFVSLDDRSPIEAPSGPQSDGSPAGYLAYVFTCGSNIKPDGMTLEQLRTSGGGIAYISMYTPEAQQAKAELDGQSFGDEDPRQYELTRTIRMGHLVAHPDTLIWYQADTAEAYQLLVEAHNTCGKGSSHRRVLPNP